MSEARESERASFKGSLPLFSRTLDKGTKRGGKGSDAKMERGKEEKRKRNCRATRVSIERMEEEGNKVREAFLCGGSPRRPVGISPRVWIKGRAPFALLCLCQETPEFRYNGKSKGGSYSNLGKSFVGHEAGALRINRPSERERVLSFQPLNELSRVDESSGQVRFDV